MNSNTVMDGALQKKRVLITGANGFIGSHLLKRLLSCGADTAALVRKSADLWRLGDYCRNVRLIKGDLRDPHSFSREIAAFKPEYVFHLAAYGANYMHQDIMSAVSVNTVGIVNLIQAIKNIPCRKLINVGSGLEYGKIEGAITEDTVPRPAGVYGSTKAAATLIAHQMASENNIGIVTLRPFAVFGEAEDRTKFFCHVILSLLENKDVALTGCEQHRDFCYVENTIDGIMLAAKSDHVDNEIFNIAGGASYPLKHYVELIFKYTKSNRRPLYGAIPYRKNEIWYPLPRTSKIKSLLTWEPRVPLEEGIKKTIEWYKKNHHLYSAG